MRALLASILLFCAAGAFAQETPPTFDQQVKALEDEIARAGKIDQKHPAFLSAQLDYAQVLARNTDVDACATRLPEAEAHYKIVRESPVAELVLAGGRGRIPVVGYYLEMARSRCTADAAQKTAALTAALKYARDGVAGYRAVFIYQPMVIMQFNVAQVLRDLGDQAQAIKELEAAIEMDRMFGFKTDAEENYRTLKEWQGAAVADADVATFIAGFAPRSATLKFGWKPTKVDASATFDNATYEGGAAKHTRFTMPMTGALKADKEDFLYEMKVGNPTIDETTLGSDMEKKIIALMARILSKLPAGEISKTGDFKGARDVEAFAKQMSKEIDDALAAALPATDPRYPAIKEAVDQGLRPYATPENLVRKIQEDFSLETGIWNGATLEQNAWITLPLTLSMNGTPQGVIEHQVEVVLARWLPCAVGKPADSCIELLLEAVPATKAVEDVASKLVAADQGKLDYAAQTRLRLVVDPATLIPYESEVLRYTYLALANKNQRAVKIAADRAVVTYRYKK
jgi:tetratricopeptide (TPR) repeat protein